MWEVLKLGNAAAAAECFMLVEDIWDLRDFQHEILTSVASTASSAHLFSKIDKEFICDHFYNAAVDY